MRIKGVFLKFDEILQSDHKFTKDSIIHIPEKVPLMWDFHRTVENVLGNGSVTRTDEGLIFDGVITYGNKEALKGMVDKCGLGGFYNGLTTHKEDGIRIVDEVSLYCVSITRSPISPDFKFEFLEEENEAMVKAESEEQNEI